MLGSRSRRWAASSKRSIMDSKGFSSLITLASSTNGLGIDILRAWRLNLGMQTKCTCRRISVRRTSRRQVIISNRKDGGNEARGVVRQDSTLNLNQLDAIMAD